MKGKWTNCFGFIADSEWKKNVVWVKRIKDQIIYVKVIVRKDTMDFINVHTSTSK